MKKFWGVLLSLIMMLSLLPMTTMASDFITKVDLNIEKPVAGETLGWHKTATTVNNDSNYKVYQNADWYDETEKRYMKLTEKFQSGHIYTVEIWVEAKDGYEFDATATAYNLKATVNGKEAKVSKAFEYQRWAMAVVSYTFPEVKEHKEITHVNVSDIIEPKIGRQSIARPHYLKYSEGVEGYDATWYENYQSTGAALALPFTGVFTEKNTYTFEVVLEAKDGYAFARKSTGLPDVVVTFNGTAVGYLIRFDGAGRLVVLEEYDYLGAAKEKIMGAVSYEIQEPVIGEKPSFKAENQREDGLYYIDTVDPNSTKYGITWYEGVGGARKMDENDTFKAGEYYYVAIKVKPIDGYQFDTDSNGDLLVKGFINRNLSVMGGNEEGMFIGYTFDKLEEEKRTIISEVEAVSNYSDIAYIGDKESTPQFTVTKGTPVRIEFTGWQTKDEKGEFVNLPHGGTFTDAPVKVLGQMVIDGDANKEYVLAKNVKLTVNGIEWLTGHSGFYDKHSACSAVSMEINTLTKKEDAKPAETDKPQETEKPQEPEEPTETEKPTQTEKPAEKPTEAEKPQDTKSNPFVDVIKGQYYYDAVLWAANEGITGGTSANTFSPEANCSRAQVVTFLHRMIASPEPAAITLPFADVKTSDYFYKPVKWAYGSKITGGTSDTAFSPDDNCTRAQVVTFLWRTAGQPEPKGKNNPFADVKSDSYYYKAVLWAVEQGITGGTSASTFSPDNNCTRAQVVTFLYRFINKQ